MKIQSSRLTSRKAKSSLRAPEVMFLLYAGVLMIFGLHALLS